MKNSKKELKKEYQQQSLQMGIYQIRNTLNGKVFIGSAQNIQGILNSNKFQLKMGGHKNKALQEDWNNFGESTFIFEVLDEITLKEGSPQTFKEELEQQLRLWLDNIEPYGEKGYNERIKSREERITNITKNKLAE